MARALSSLAVLATLAAASPAYAQAQGQSGNQSDPMAMAHLAAANELGILQYCQSKGAVGPDAIAAERDVMSHMPASTVATGPAEDAGKQGKFMGPNGQQTTIEGLAGQHGTTVASMCQQLGSSVVQTASLYRQNSGATGSLPGMPAMPGGITSIPGLPSMPQGLTGLPGLPAPPAKQ